MGTRCVLHRTFALAAMAATPGFLSCSSNSGPAYSQFAQKCQTPSSGAYQQGTLADEKNWLRAWTDDLYLWYGEVPNVNPATCLTAIDYFNVLRTPALTPSGNPKDKFHFSMGTAQWQAFAQSGIVPGYGVTWAVVARCPPRSVVAAFVEPGSEAAAKGIVRGTQIIQIDGANVVDGSAATLNAGLSPANVNEPHNFTIQNPGQAQQTPITLTSANVTETPVQNVGVLSGTSVGYILFNDHIATAEGLLVSAIKTLKSQGVTDLVLDIRYNGGGFLTIADELAFMIAGAPSAGRTFEQITFNDKHQVTDPVTGAPLAPVPFVTTTQGFSTNPPAGTTLPTLNLSRVAVITGSGTCSASESVINGLRGVGVQVIQIGSTTCGKPYGFYPADNCGTTYFSIQFKGVNALGFGDYPDGFTPGGSGTTGLPGCPVADDFSHFLGDPAEARIAAALQYLGSGSCPAPTSPPADTCGATPPPATTCTTAAAARSALTTASADDVVLVRPPWRENRILTPPRQ